MKSLHVLAVTIADTYRLGTVLLNCQSIRIFEVPATRLKEIYCILKNIMPVFITIILCRL